MDVCVSTGKEICVLSETGEVKRRAALDGAGALCASGDRLLCAADMGRAVYQLSKDSLTPEGLLPGGPGLCDLLVSADGMQMYLLLGEADSVVLCDAKSGQPLVLQRVGCNPRQMALSGDTLAVAGGESGYVHLFDAQTLHERARLPMPGPVYSAAFAGGALHALCMMPSLDTALVTLRGSERSERALRGMPGRLIIASQMTLMLDPFSERLLARDGAGRWRMLHANVVGACIL